MTAKKDVTCIGCYLANECPGFSDCPKLQLFDANARIAELEVERDALVAAVKRFVDDYDALACRSIPNMEGLRSAISDYAKPGARCGDCSCFDGGSDEDRYEECVLGLKGGITADTAGCDKFDRRIDAALKGGE